ncbi:nuclear transport factor 2 family protein [Pseudomonas gingeri]|uniref:Nuclear transport factor 2 family protein n=1 Tax=Pseudomonas gingeri TaxID=117681 RepID=A0A7Y8CLD1_9PSED|nr:nuclear transport factor 2 family protein [Pseudomonas gingeri]NWB31826.1 nuclear transport factor 2 family protein [Pseudomonas gingeri]NWC35001.1 nuclear transport factor 2 family protein [Pseudomonas gingeri]NWD52481.1 nuclear transport factor 2 family protein [Pseudomonas gingeri]
MSSIAELVIDNPVEVVNEFFSAWAKQDLKTVIEIFSEDAVYCASQGPEPGKTYRGRQEIESAVQVMFDAASETKLKLVAIYPFEGGVTATWEVSGTDSNGQSVAVLGIDVFLVRNGHVTLKDAYRKVKS